MERGRRGRINQKRTMCVAAFVMVILMMLALSQFNDSMILAENTRNEERLKDLAKQASLMAERRLQSSISALETAAKVLEEEEDLHADKVLEFMSRIASANKMDRIGVTNKKGMALTTGGNLVNSVNALYFQESMKGNVYISTVFQNSYSPEKGLAVSVPIYEKSGNINGVLYGVLPVDAFNVYVNSSLSNQSESFVHIIDSNGNYIVKSNSKSSMGSAEENYFTTLERLGIHTKDVEKLIKEKETAVEHINKDGEKRVMFFAPMHVNNWCVVTVLTGEAADANIDYARKIVLRLIVKLFLAIGALITVVFFILEKEKVEVKRLNQELSIKDKIFQIAITETGGFVFKYDLQKRCLQFLNKNEEVEEMFPSQVEDISEYIHKFVPQGTESDEELQRIFTEISCEKESVKGEVCVDHNGNVYYYSITMTRIPLSESGGKPYAVGTIVDVTKERQNEVFLKNQIGRDPLTNTYNRLAAKERINEILKSEKYGSCAFLIIDLDYFKKINDTLGHSVGDKALIDVANTIRDHVHAQDVVCRLGGDEFIVFLIDIPRYVIRRNVEALIKKLNMTYEMDGKSEAFSASVGIAVAPQDGAEFQELYEKADTALYEVKKNGKNGYAFYEEKLKLAEENYF